VAAGPVSRILSADRNRQDGHSSRPRITAGLKRPTRRFDAPSQHVPQANPKTSSLFGLAPCGVYLACCIAAAAVRSYRTFSPLPRRGFRSRRLGATKSQSQSGAVCFLWHFPSAALERDLPDVIRHTALRSSDFPLPAPRHGERPSGPAANKLYYIRWRPAGCEVRRPETIGGVELGRKLVWRALLDSREPAGSRFPKTGKPDT